MPKLLMLSFVVRREVEVRVVFQYILRRSVFFSFVCDDDYDEVYLVRSSIVELKSAVNYY